MANLLRKPVKLASVALFLIGMGCRNQVPGRIDGQTVPVEISVWSMWSGQEERNFNRVLRLYELEHPEVRIRNLGGVSDDSKTIRALVAGAPPDLFTLSNPAYLGVLARNGAIRPLDSLLEGTAIRKEDFIPASLRLCEYEGKLYGLPYLIDVAALMWDKQAFREAGLDPERPPQTMEELADYAVRLTKRDASGKITRLGLRRPDDLTTFYFCYGGTLADPKTGKITANHPGNIAGLAWYKDLVERLGGIEKINAFSSSFGSNQGVNNPFFTGKVAMQIDGEWNPYWISRYAPQLSYDVAPVPPPAAHPERTGTTTIGGNVFCIPTDCKHPAEVSRFLLWMESRKAQIQFAHDMNNVPNMRSALHAPELRTGTLFRKQYGKFCDLADSPNAFSFPVTPVASMLMKELGNAADRTLYREETPEQALNRAQERVQKELNEQ